MRVIAGTYRSRRLQAPAGHATRPTSDRLRETLFNVLGTAVEGAWFADLYAGSGAVGIEALSRGARGATFVERARPAELALRRNLAALGISAERATVVGSPVAAWLAGRGSGPASGSSPDIVFLDPPYELLDEYERTLSALGGPASVSAPASMAVAEHARRHALRPAYGRLLRYRVLEQGDSALSFFRRQES